MKSHMQKVKCEEAAGYRPDGVVSSDPASGERIRAMSDKEYREFEKNTCKHIKGVNCDVKNCAYHDGDSYCTADKIAVGPSYACTCTDTVCATFKSRES